MKVCKTVDEIRAYRWLDPRQSWGLVPTMGFLHEGHISLVRRARGENDYVAVSIFVNPAQFAPHEDLQAYPRNLQRDLSLLEQEEVDLVFVPDDSTMYPPRSQTFVIVSEVAQPLEGASRPTHFRGVTTVVAKLFNIIQPQRAYFGQKDAQQVVVVQRMIKDLDFNVELVVCPIVRESDGLAMSSRNERLSASQRLAAPVLFRALTAAESAFFAGQRQASDLRQIMIAEIEREPLARLDYVSVANPETLLELDVVEDKALLSGAIFIGDVRLIDNIPIEMGLI